MDDRTHHMYDAGGKLFLASVDDHTVHSLDAESGKVLFIAGAK